MAMRQLKITRFRKATSAKSTNPKASKRADDTCDDIQEEINQLEQTLRDKQDELFQIQRNAYKIKALQQPARKIQHFIRPEEMIKTASIESLKLNLKHMSMLTGMEVQSYVAGDHCCIVYHMQYDAGYPVKHGLRIEMQDGDNVVSKSSLPLGFNLKAVTDEFDNIMMPQCLGAIHIALVAYHERLGQFDKLNKLLNIRGELFKLLDGSIMEIAFYVQNTVEEDDEILHVTLRLNYRIYDIKPRTYEFNKDLPEEVSQILKQQCLILKKKPLDQAFKEAFITGVGVYKLYLEPVQTSVREEHRHRPQKRHHSRNNHNDDTFLPEECSDQGEDEEPDY